MNNGRRFTGRARIRRGPPVNRELERPQIPNSVQVPFLVAEKSRKSTRHRRYNVSLCGREGQRAVEPAHIGRALLR